MNNCLKPYPCKSRAPFNTACCLFLLFYLSLPAFSQEDETFKWKEKGIYEASVDTFPGEHLLILKKDVVLSAMSDYSSLFTHLKMKVLIEEDPKAGIPVQIPYYDFKTVRTIGVRIISPDGKVVEIPEKDLRHVAADSVLDKNPEGEIFTYLIPGTKAGDEVEIAILLTLRNLHSYGEILLNDPDHYCLRSSYTTNFPKGYLTDYKYYNNMPSALVDSSKGDIRSYWALKNLPALHAEPFSIPEAEYPYVRFAIRAVSLKDYCHNTWYYEATGEPSSWFDYTTSLAEVVSLAPPFIRNRLTKHFNTQYDVYLTYSLNPDTVSRIIRFFNYVHDHMHVVDVPYEKYDNAIDYYLKRNEILEPFMIFFFDRMFRELNLNYFIGLGKDKYTGPYDQAFVSGKMATHMFIGFEFQNHFYYFFFSTKTKSYEFGEMPTCLRGTEAMLISKNNVEFPVQKFTFPVADKSTNFSKTNIFLDIDPDKNTVLRKDRLTLSGDMSTDYRFGYTQTAGKEGNLIVKTAKQLKASGSGYVLDSVKVDRREKTIPFVFILQTNAHRNSILHEGDKNQVQIPLKGIIQHHLLPASARKRTTRLFTPYLYDDDVKIYLVFKQKIKLLNGDKLAANWSGIPGHSYLKAMQINETTIMVESDYAIDAERMSPEEADKLVELNASTAGLDGMSVEVALVP